MRLVIQNGPQDVAEWLATYVKQRINDFKPTAERPFVIGLPTGSTPIPTYKKLIEFHKKGELSFRHVVSFNMDEYVGLPRDHDQSYHSFMYNNLFRHVDINPSNVHILDGMAEDLQGECDKFEKAILDHGGIELQLAGFGQDGHIAFNEPGSSLHSRTRIKTLAYDTILANARFFEGKLSAVPRMALTVGVGTIMDAREVIAIATGAHKALALSKCIEEGISHLWTASVLQNHQRACIVCDEDATLELRVKTVRYFKGLQETQAKMLRIPMGGYEGNFTHTPALAAVGSPSKAASDVAAAEGGGSVNQEADGESPRSLAARMGAAAARSHPLSAAGVMAAVARSHGRHTGLKRSRVESVDATKLPAAPNEGGPKPR